MIYIQVFQCIVFMLVLIDDINCFKIQTTIQKLYGNKISLRNNVKVMMDGGGHGQNFHYLPVHRGSLEEHFPRIIPIAGVFPGITTEQLNAPYSSPAAPVGQWVYEFTDPEGPQLGTIALPGSTVMTDAVDPVALITNNTILGISCIEDVEMIAVVDRGEKDFYSGDFFLFKDMNTNEFFIQWYEKLPPNHIEILGKIIQCAIPLTEKMKPVETGFLEDD